MNPHPPIQPPVPASTGAVREGYPLGILFLLVAIFSVLMAMGALGLRSRAMQEANIDLIGACVGSAIAGSIFGAITGLFHHRRTRGILLGALSGTIVAPLAVPILAADASLFLPLMAVSLFGSCLVLSLAAAVRLGAARK